MIVFCLGLGAVAGFFAGLFGIGAGVLMVPALHELYAAHGFGPELSLRLALGTSMAGIVFNSLSSLSAHHRRGAVRWPVVIRLSPGIVVGTLAGSQLAGQLPVRWLSVFFAGFLLLIAVQMALDMRPKATRTLPGTAGLAGVGGAIGVIMSLIAGGGGMLSIPFLIWCNVGLREAIGTAAAIGFPIAVSGSLGYVLSGWSAAALPAYSLGYVFLPALAATAATSSLTAPLGARAAHRLPTAALRRGFALFLLLVAARMLYKTL